jgi:hypothetical protein
VAPLPWQREQVPRQQTTPAWCCQLGQDDGELADGMETVHDNLL